MSDCFPHAVNVLGIACYDDAVTWITERQPEPLEDGTVNYVLDAFMVQHKWITIKFKKLAKDRKHQWRTVYPLIRNDLTLPRVLVVVKNHCFAVLNGIVVDPSSKDRSRCLVDDLWVPSKRAAPSINGVTRTTP